MVQASKVARLSYPADIAILSDPNKKCTLYNT